jgi:CheY-like chemotaxis protein
MQAMKIAVADDEPEMREFLARACRSCGHDVVLIAENGAELSAGCLLFHPDLVITDIRMPLVDGLTALSQVRDEYPVRSIIISAHDSPQLHQQAVELGSLAVLIKPVGMAQLRPLLQSAPSSP